MKKQIKDIHLNKVEGEVSLKLIWDKNGFIEDAFVIAPNYRGFERILEGRDILDALVINPRICGICGHSHLLATLRAIENLYKNNGYEVQVSKKAKLIRQITQTAEVVQNHIKWIYIFIMPDLVKLTKEDRFEEYFSFKGKKWKEGVKASGEIIKICAIFGGQWPHTSYMIPGGITSEPLSLDIVNAISIVDNLIKFCEDNIVGTTYEKYLSIDNLEEYLSIAKPSLLKDFIKISLDNDLQNIGKSYNHFITVSNIFPCIVEGVIKKKKCKFNVDRVKEIKDFNILENKENGYTMANGVRYDGLPMETGPLARRLISETPLFLKLHKYFGDSFFVRVWARIDEILRLVVSMKSYLLSIDLKEPSYIKPKVNYKDFNGIGIGLTEAARGSLIHRVNVSNGKIKEYQIITPTVWNLGSRCRKYKAVAEKALIGLDSELKAQLVLRSFDVCSVCLTH